MAIDIPRVQPGDLITASFFNAVLGELEALDQRLAKVEAGEGTSTPGAVTIATVTPTQVHVGDDLTIVGDHFGFSLGAHRVRFDGVPTPRTRSGSSDRVLVCQVPVLPGLPAAGRSVTLSVSNATSTATRVVTVLPPDVGQVGDVDTELLEVSPDPLQAGRDNDFTFRLRSDALLAETMVLEPVLRTAQGRLAWPSSVLTEDLRELPGQTVTLPPGGEVVVVVRVQVPADVRDAAFTLELSATGPVLRSSSTPLDFTVGAEGDPSPDIDRLSLSASPGVEGTTITCPAGSRRTVPVEVDLTAAGEYDITFQPVEGLVGWTPSVISPADRVLIVTPQEVVDGLVDKVIKLRVSVAAGAGNGQLRLHVQRRGSDRGRSLLLTANVD